MEFNLVFLLNSALFGIGLAMDAFSVSVANGLNNPDMPASRCLTIAGVFGIFQTAMPLLGWLCVHTVVETFQAVEPLIPWIALVLLVFIGGKMILEGLRPKEEKEKTALRLQTAYGTAKKYEMSEWCELPLTLDSSTIESGLRMANVMYEDLSIMDAISWQSWTAVNGDGLMDYKDGELVQYQRYYIMKQFAMIPMGAKRVGVLDSHLEQTTLKTLAYTDGTTDYLVIINNGDEAQEITLKGVYASKAVYVTAGDHRCEKVAEGALLHKTEILPKSVTTVVMTKSIVH